MSTIIPTVSILIATYNSGKTLRRALDSVLSQSYTDWECVLVDGTSKDETLKIISEFEAIDHRFRHISEPDKGIYDAFNKGWKIARGEWIYYLGSDDALVKDGILNILKLPTNADVLYGSVYGYSYGGKKISQGKFSVISKAGDMVSHQAMLMKRNLIESAGGFDMKYKVSADFDLVTRLFGSGAKFEMRQVYLCYFSTGGASCTLDDVKDSYSICMKYCPNKVNITLRYLKKYIRKWYWINLKWPLVDLYLSLKSK